MIRRCFSVFDGVGPGRVRAIRDAGIDNWDQLLAAADVPGLGAKLHNSVAMQVRRWQAALQRGDAKFFAAALARSEHWMLFELFAAGVRYLDIETTGLSPARHDVTVVGISDGRRYQALVKDKNLSAQAIRDALAGCKLLVTYYGRVFDVPFLRACFPQVAWDDPHFDMCFGARRVGLTGGLKGVERSLGIRRDPSITEVDGFEAVRLWRRHERGDPTALQTLLRYNEADTCNLATIARIVYPRLCAKAAP